jgi:hypothetical protein
MKQEDVYKNIIRLLMSKQYFPSEMGELAEALHYLGEAVAKLEKKKEEEPVEMEPSPSDTGVRAVGE